MLLYSFSISLIDLFVINYSLQLIDRFSLSLFPSLALAPVTILDGVLVLAVNNDAAELMMMISRVAAFCWTPKSPPGRRRPSSTAGCYTYYNYAPVIEAHHRQRARRRNDQRHRHRHCRWVILGLYETASSTSPVTTTEWLPEYSIRGPLKSVSFAIATTTFPSRRWICNSDCPPSLPLPLPLASIPHRIRISVAGDVSNQPSTGIRQHAGIVLSIILFCTLRRRASRYLLTETPSNSQQQHS